MQGGGRIDNPSVYSVLYLSNDPAGAIAEAFGRFAEWTEFLFDGPPSLPGSARALASFHLDDSTSVCDLDDPKQLLRLRLRPSDVVSRDYTRTREWALRVYEQQTWAGIRWWSYYDPRWTSYGLWDLRKLRLKDVTPLQLDDPAVVEASRTIARRIMEPRRKPRPVLIARKRRPS